MTVGRKETRKKAVENTETAALWPASAATEPICPIQIVSTAFVSGTTRNDKQHGISTRRMRRSRPERT
jgi:hypothetical protein